MSTISTVTATLESTPYLVTFTDDLGHIWSADEPTDVGGGNSATSPDRLILASLGACTAITLQMVATRRKWPLTGVQIELQLNPNGKLETGHDIVRKITVQGDLSEEQLTQLHKIANACPMHKLLTGEIRIHTELTLVIYSETSSV
jgi:putative redox protein